jgi:hypothetical protein
VFENLPCGLLNYLFHSDEKHITAALPDVVTQIEFCVPSVYEDCQYSGTQI